jgi:hypothetical protein
MKGQVFMPTDYETRNANANATDAAALAALLNLPVTVDKHGMARVNAAELLKVLSSLPR